MDEIMNKLSQTFDSIQTLNITAERKNMAIMLFALDTLKEAYSFIESLKAAEGGAEDGTE